MLAKPIMAPQSPARKQTEFEEKIQQSEIRIRNLSKNQSRKSNSNKKQTIVKTNLAPDFAPHPDEKSRNSGVQTTNSAAAVQKIIASYGSQSSIANIQKRSVSPSVLKKIKDFNLQNQIIEPDGALKTRNLGVRLKATASVKTLLGIGAGGLISVNPAPIRATS